MKHLLPPSIRLLLVLSAVLTATSVQAQGRAENSAKDAVYACDAAASREAVVAAADQLYPAKHDKNKFGCAADLYFRAAQMAPVDAMLDIQALLVTAEYIDQINTLWDFDLYGVRQPEWAARLAHAVSQGRLLADRVERTAGRAPMALAARALFQVSAAAKTADAKTQLAGVRDAIGMLTEATRQDLGLLDGNAVLVLARLYYETPEFVGGDTDKALVLLDQALKAAPMNPSVIRYAAYVQVQERHIPAAKILLDKLPAIEPGIADRQSFVDELRSARDLAARIQDEALQQRLDARRDALLKQNPQLLTRASSAANMHGGVDPITGKPY